MQIGPPELVLFFDCRKEVAEHRFLTRKIPGRDDSKELFDRRYREFTEVNPQVVAFYEIRGILIQVRGLSVTHSLSFRAKRIRRSIQMANPKFLTKGY